MGLIARMFSLPIHYNYPYTYLSPECLNNKLKVVRVNTFYTLLYYMITILVFHTLQHMAV